MHQSLLQEIDNHAPVDKHRHSDLWCPLFLYYKVVGLSFQWRTIMEEDHIEPDLIEQVEVLDLNEHALSTIAIGRPRSCRFQPSLGPQSSHSIFRTIGSLMASIANVVALMLPLLDNSASFLLDSRDNTPIAQSIATRTPLVSHIVPSCSQAL